MTSSRFEECDQDDDVRPTTASSKALHRLFADEQAFTWKEHPLTASYEGQRAYDDRLESDLPTDFERRADGEREVSRTPACDRRRVAERRGSDLL